MLVIGKLTRFWRVPRRKTVVNHYKDSIVMRHCMSVNETRDESREAVAVVVHLMFHLSVFNILANTP